MAGSYPLKLKLQAEALVRAGHSASAISRDLGVARTTVLRWTDPAYAKRYREQVNRWRARNRDRVRAYFREGRRPDLADCEGCGGKMAYNRARATTGRCDHCRSEDMRWRRLDIQRLWREALTAREIGVRLGISKGAVEAIIMRMRRDGWDMPRRA